MGKLLSEDSASPGGRRAGASGVRVESVAYRNSAARFWTSLLDEVVEDFPSCDALEIESVSGGLLSPVHLDPAAMLQRDMRGLEGTKIDDLVRDVVAELEVLGPPAAVEARVFEGPRLVCARVLPYEVVDAELMPFLIVWLLEWARLAEFSWNGAEVRGLFVATDPERGLEYPVRYELRNTHLSEGLYRRVVRLAPLIRRAASR